jgi:hypothetical protein
MTRITFEEISRRGSKTVPCSTCGRKVHRDRRFANTLNPWNVNPDGTPRSREEIWDHLGVLIAAWALEPETCPEHRP